MTRSIPLIAIGLVAVLASGCGGSGSTTNSATQGAGPNSPATAGKVVLPVPQNPITNNSTTAGLTITKALVENNVSPDTGKGIDDHLELALKNTSSKPLGQIEVYYKISDRAKGVSEGYHARLGAFSIKPGATRVAHFDNTGAADHYAVNKYSLYYADKNELVVEVTASSPGFKPATFMVKKDSGGAEAGVE